MGFKSVVLVFFALSASAADVPTGSLKDFKWKTGQIISGSQPDTFLFEAITASRHGHIGVVAVENGKTYVYESTRPIEGGKNGVQKTEIATFLARMNQNLDGNPLVAVVSPKRGFSAKEEQTLLDVLRESDKQGIRYDDMHDGTKTYREDKPRELDCSSYVQHVFHKLTARTDKNPQWFPAVATQIKTLNHDAFGNKLQAFSILKPTKERLEMSTITPSSITESSEMNVHFSNIPLGYKLSDQEILEAWKDGLPLYQQSFYSRFLTDKAPIAYKDGLKKFVPRSHKVRAARSTPEPEEKIKKAVQAAWNKVLEQNGGHQAVRENNEYLFRLMQKGDPGAIRILLGIANDDDSEIATPAFWMLSASFDPSVITKLIDPVVRELGRFTGKEPEDMYLCAPLARAAILARWVETIVVREYGMPLDEYIGARDYGKLATAVENARVRVKKMPTLCAKDFAAVHKAFPKKADRSKRLSQNQSLTH